MTTNTGVKRSASDMASNGPGKKMQQDGIEDEMITEAFGLDEIEDEMETEGVELDVEVELGEAGRNWMRPPPKVMDAKKEALIFQQLELDYTSGPPNAEYYASASRYELQDVPILRMFGVNSDGMCMIALTFSPERRVSFNNLYVFDYRK